MARKLSKEAVLERLYKMQDPTLIRVGKAWLNKKLKPRSGAEREGRVPMGQKVLMKKMHDAGLSFRAAEVVFHLVDNSGNMAQRCVDAAEDHLKAKGSSKKELVEA